MKGLKRFATVVLLLIMGISAAFARDKFALVLSGGGARGLAHIPVIRELENRGIVPDLVVGTSMGALIGGLYASGYSSDEIEALLFSSDIMGALLNINNITESSFENSSSNIFVLEFGSTGIGAKNGVIDDSKINSILRKSLLKVLSIDDFDSLSIPFRSVGFNIVNGDEIVFDSGSIFNALRGSMSLPIMFPPLKLDDKSYIMDGGLINNLPVDVAKDLGADIILAVDVNDATNTHRSMDADAMETLSGVVGAFSISLNMINSTKQYKDADWVLVPKVSGFSTVDFSKMDQILKAGKDYVYENIAVFDKLEKRLGSRKERSYTKYSEREYPEIERVEIEGLTGFDKLLLSYKGKTFDETTMDALEDLLSQIKRFNRYKDVLYDFSNGVLTITTVPYKVLNGFVSMGANGSFGLMYDGVSSPYFSILPSISVSMQYSMTRKALLSMSLNYKDTLSLGARISVPFARDLSFYAGVGFDYMDLSLYSIPTSRIHVPKGDISSSAELGVYWSFIPSFMLKTSLGFEYFHFTAFKNPIDEEQILIPKSDIGYIYSKTKLGFDALDKKDGMANGFKAYFGFDLGTDFKMDGSNSFKFAYNIYGEGEAVFGFPGFFKGIAELEFDTIRRNSLLSSGYVSTKTGVVTSDYAYLLLGLRGRIPNSPFFIDLAPFVEAFSKPYDSISGYMNASRSLVPFSTLSDWTFGLKLGLGVNTPIGIAYMDFYAGSSDVFRCSLLFGIR